MGEKATLSSSAFSFSAAGLMSGLWNGPDTLRKTAFLYPYPLQLLDYLLQGVDIARQDQLVRGVEVGGRCHVVALGDRVAGLFHLLAHRGP